MSKLYSNHHQEGEEEEEEKNGQVSKKLKTASRSRLRLKRVNSVCKGWLLFLNHHVSMECKGNITWKFTYCLFGVLGSWLPSGSLCICKYSRTFWACFLPWKGNTGIAFASGCIGFLADRTWEKAAVFRCTNVNAEMFIKTHGSSWEFKKSAVGRHGSGIGWGRAS